ncbi:MAG TPA: ATP-binding cassette domain-containing protein [Labilithrix sp.]|nr:ATP-binding cassette domain-containing protein [Labilithrix sp.]
MEWKLEARALSRQKPDGAWLLRDASLVVEPGDRIGLGGESGAGKTVLLRALAALDPLQGGSLWWSGEELSERAMPLYRSRAVYLHQRPALVEGTVADNLALPFTLGVHAAKELDRARAHDLLEALGKPRAFLDKSHAELSGGEAQITALVRTLLVEPAILFLDEPTASLDAKSATLVERALRSWLDEAKTRRALVCASHDLAFTDALTTRGLSMHGGTLTAAAPR